MFPSFPCDNQIHCNCLRVFFRCRLGSLEGPATTSQSTFIFRRGTQHTSDDDCALLQGEHPLLVLLGQQVRRDVVLQPQLHVTDAAGGQEGRKAQGVLAVRQHVLRGLDGHLLVGRLRQGLARGQGLAAGQAAAGNAQHRSWPGPLAGTTPGRLECQSPAQPTLTV